MEAELKADEWELLSPNTSFLRFGLEDIKDLYSTEIDYLDYFIEQPTHPLNHIIDSEDDQPSQQPTIHHDKSLSEIKVEDLKQTEAKDDIKVEKDEEDLADKLPRSKPRRRPAIVAMIVEMVPIAAAMACGFLLASGRRRTETVRFQIYKDDKEMKEMVRRANRINQLLLGTARGLPPPAMRPATISFGRCFRDML